VKSGDKKRSPKSDEEGKIVAACKDTVIRSDVIPVVRQHTWQQIVQPRTRA